MLLVGKKLLNLKDAEQAEQDAMVERVKNVVSMAYSVRIEHMPKSMHDTSRSGRRFS